MLENQAQRIKDAKDVPLLMEGNHSRPAKFIGETACHDGNEEFNLRLIFERPPGMPIAVSKIPVTFKEKPNEKS